MRVVNDSFCFLALYEYTIYANSALITVYIICNIYNLLWALLPHLGVLSTFMRAYEKSRRAAQVGMKQDDKQILGDLYDIYYHNRDLRLFLELLAVSSGVAPALSVMALFDGV